ncbi:hypothetical protein FEM48_Zijuj03G0051700 [Ziziphus jujuba var. spinosa]|uniref:Uncharacterized protein n=1 Tax=Ziziphus jujuba var. spinosa TaxID=714518 RepID=A0A978VND1_ZIZJJ|nr:hypothetical protein FEM48_Zijuj03G0051700 [Ziziphus jujuba var. spinosa]
MALSASSASLSSSLGFISRPHENPRSSFRYKHVILGVSEDESSRTSIRVSANSGSRARFVARREESISVRQLARPLREYMSLPASQYSVLDAERIERVDDNTFRCYVYKFKFFAFEVCPVLLVKVEEQPNGCCIKLLSCKEVAHLEGSPMVVAQNDKFDGKDILFISFCQRTIPFTFYAKYDGRNTRDVDPCFVWSALTLIWYGNAAYMVNKISCDSIPNNLSEERLTSDTVIEVSIQIPFSFLPIPVDAIESSGTQVLQQILRIMLPRFMAQLVKDYEAWASGDTSRQPLGTGEI